MRSCAQADSSNRPSSAVMQVAMMNSVVTSSAIGAFAADPSMVDDPSSLFLMRLLHTIILRYVIRTLFAAFVDAFVSRVALKRKTSKKVQTRRRNCFVRCGCNQACADYVDLPT